ncbi:unnamed protein product [Rhizophagus irregularis]|nr:unnamed protein product [Rhizophagus irregularis]
MRKPSFCVHSISEIPFLVRIDKTISSYFEDKPTLWSYDSFLEKLKPLIMEDEDAELPSVWRKRFLTALKEITDDDTKDEQVRYIADLLSKQKLTATNASFWKKLHMEKNRKSSEANLHHKKSIFIFNSQIEALGVLELARKLQAIRATNELDQYINTNSNNTTMNILEIVNPAKCSEQDDESTKPDEGTIAKLLAQILQYKSKNAGSLTQVEDQRLSLKKCQSEIDPTQDEDQRLSFKKCRSEIYSTQDDNQKLLLKNTN